MKSHNSLSYIEKKEKSQNIIRYGILVALVSFLLHLTLQTLTRSVLMTSFPQYMMPSYFSTISLYILAAFIMYIVYMIRYYDLLTFAEISANKWYTLAINGYDPLKMTLTKLLLRLKEIMIYYSIGYVVTILLTMLMQYPFIANYLISLYITGLVDIIFVSVVTMECSLFITEQRDARLVIILSAVIIWVLRLNSGFYELVSNPVAMQNITHLFDYFGQSNYLLYFLFVVIACLITLIIRARKISQYTNFPFYEKDMDLDEGERIVIPKQDSYEDVVNQFIKHQHHKRFDQLVLIAFTAAIVLSIMLNLFVLFVSSASPEKKSELLGQIAYVMDSEDMEPDINCNDLVIFKAIHRTDEIAVNDIILYEGDGEAQSAYVDTIDKQNQRLSVHTGTKDHLTIRRDDVYGIYTTRSPWLGVLLLFGNTLIGRFLFLLIPVVLLYYYKPLKKYLSRRGMSRYHS